MNQPPWLQALEAQLDALSSVKRLLSIDIRDRRVGRLVEELNSSWQVDRRLLETATPYAWSEDVMQAVLAASKSIPLDTYLNQWNLTTTTSFWHFAKPLPFKTTKLDIGVRAVVFGVVPTTDRTFGIPVCSWMDDPLDKWKIIPTQTFEWGNNDTLETMLEHTRKHHERLYGPGGMWSDREHIDVDDFMATAEGLARFMLAALAWMSQKVLVTDGGHIERHRRKAFNRETKQTLDKIRVVQLRRPEYPQRPASEGEEPVEWSCRWVVAGHWRNQACGPHHADRQLRYIMPFVKGPADKPMKTAQTVYEVRR